MRGKFFLLMILITLPLFGAQCISFQAGGGGSDGGVFKTINSGSDWKQKALIPTVTGTPRTFAGADILNIAQDPSDRLAIYIGTKVNGLFYSYDGGESWRQPKEITSGAVSAVAVDPRDKCNIYATAGNRVLRSTDCNRSYGEVYRDEGALTDLVVDSYNSQIIYLGTSKGTVLKSQDSGRTWSVLKNFGGQVIDVVLNTRDTRVIYAAIAKKGVWESNDGGANWIDLTSGLKQFPGVADVKRLVISRSDSDTLVFASKYGLLRSSDGGATWEGLKLLTKPGSVEIYSLAIGPSNSSQLYYGTASTFYKTQDGGATWSTKRLPTTRVASFLMVDNSDPATIYMGVTKIEK